MLYILLAHMLNYFNPLAIVSSTVERLDVHLYFLHPNSIQICEVKKPTVSNRTENMVYKNKHQFTRIKYFL